jgi:hypothetical protein
MRRVRRSLANRAAASRLVATLSVAAFLLGNLGSLFHQATTAHTVCPEHGELIHGDSEELAAAGTASHADRFHHLRVARGEDPAAPYQAAESEPDRVRDRTRAASHEHDHCFVCSPSRERSAAPAATSPGEDAAHASRAPLAHAAVPGSAGRALYRTAPKTSPPA